MFPVMSHHKLDRKWASIKRDKDLSGCPKTKKSIQVPT